MRREEAETPRDEGAGEGSTDEGQAAAGQAQDDRFDPEDDFIGPEEEMPVPLEELAPGWNWRLKLRPRPKLTADSPVFRANAASIRRWCESPEPHKAPPPTPRRPPPADWRTPRRMGGFEILVILALVRQDGGGCASDVRALIASRTGRLVSIHSVAKAIQRLLKRRYVCPAPAPHRWRDFFTSRKFYRVEPLGRRAARLTLLAGDRMREGIVGLHPGSVGLGAEVPEPGTERRPQFRPA